MIFRGEFFTLTLRVVRDHQLQRVKHGHGAQSLLIQVFAQAIFQKIQRNPAVHFGHADPFTEIANGGRGVATASQTRKRRHTRVIPTIHDTLFHERAQLALAHHRVVQIEAGKFNLTRF